MTILINQVTLEQLTSEGGDDVTDEGEEVFDDHDWVVCLCLLLTSSTGRPLPSAQLVECDLIWCWAGAA